MGTDDLAAGIVAGVGGPANIRSVGHCTTRLRLVLANRGAADRDVVRALPGVMSTVERGGQFQVVIGQHVGHVDTAVRSLVSAAKDGAPVGQHQAQAGSAVAHGPDVGGPADPGDDARGEIVEIHHGAGTSRWRNRLTCTMRYSSSSSGRSSA